MNILQRPTAMFLAKLMAHMQKLRGRLKIQCCISGGMTVGKDVSIHWSALIDDLQPYLISIGDNCHICDGVCLLVHDAALVRFTDRYIRLNKVDIKDNCVIGPNSIILPGVTIGPNVVVGAGSLVNSSIGPNSYAAGVPARVHSELDEVVKRHKEQIKERPTFRYEEVCFRPGKGLRERIKNAVTEGDVYVIGFKDRHSIVINAAQG